MTDQPISPGAKAPVFPLATATAPLAPVTAAVPPVLASAAANAAAQAGEQTESEAESAEDEAPGSDAEPPIETPTPTQAEIDDIKRGVRVPDPPVAAPAKKVRNIKPGRDGASTTRDI